MFKYFSIYLSTIFFFFHCYCEELNKKGFFADAAVLYWKASEDGLSFAVEKSFTDSSSAKVENPEFEWDFGFKLGLGYRFPHDRWNLLLQFTSFQTHTDNEKEARDSNFLLPLWQKSTVDGSFFIKEAKIHWRLHLGVGDLMLNKFYKVTKNLALIPEVGIRGGAIRQKYYLEYRGENFSARGVEIIHMKNKFFGIGPNVGLLGQWTFDWGFSLFTKNALSLLFGEFYVHQDEYSGKEKLLGVHNIFVSTAATFEVCAGIRWQRDFQGVLKRLVLEIAWDELLFFSQNQLVHFPNASAPGVFFTNQGDLAVSGIEFNICFDF